MGLDQGQHADTEGFVAGAGTFQVGLARSSGCKGQGALKESLLRLDVWDSGLLEIRFLLRIRIQRHLNAFDWIALGIGEADGSFPIKGPGYHL